MIKGIRLDPGVLSDLAATLAGASLPVADPAEAGLSLGKKASSRLKHFRDALEKFEAYSAISMTRPSAI